MSYPLRSSLRSNVAFALWWGYARSFVTDVCEINPSAWLTQVRAAFGLPASTAWGADLSAALIAFARGMQQRDAAWGPIAEQLEMDAVKHSPSQVGFTVATWKTFYQANGLRLSSMSVPTDIELPGETEPVPATLSTNRPTNDPVGGDRLVCYRVDRETPATNLTAAQRRQAETASSLGLRDRPGESREQDPGVIDVGQSGVSLGTVGVAAVLILAAAGMVAVASTSEAPKKPVRARANPSKRRRKKSRKKGW